MLYLSIFVLHCIKMHVFQICMVFLVVFLSSVLDAGSTCVQHRTLVGPASNTFSWLNSVLKRWFCFRCRFPHFVGSGTCLDTHACCQTPISQFYALHCLLSRSFSPRTCFPIACRLALHGFFRRFVFSPALHLGQWCLLSGVLTNQGSFGLEHKQCC